MIALRLTAEQLAAARVIGWRRLVVLALLSGDTDARGRVEHRSVRDVAGLLGVHHSLVARDVAALETRGLLVVTRTHGRPSAITINATPQVSTARASTQVSTAKVSTPVDHQGVDTSHVDRSTVDTTVDHQGVDTCRPPPKGGAATPPADPHVHASARPTGAPLQLIASPKPRVKTWD